MPTSSASTAFEKVLEVEQVSLVPFVTPRDVIFAILCVGGAFNVFENFYIIFVHGGVGRNGSTVAGTSVLFPVIPIATVILIAIVISKKSRVLFIDNICIYILMFGMVFVKVTLNVIIAHVTKSALHFVDSVYIGPALLFMNQYFNCVLKEYYVLCIALVYCVADVSYHSFALISQISNFLGISIFSFSPSKTTAAMSLSSPS